MARIFISYRRNDEAFAAGRVADTLRARFGRRAVFSDSEIVGGVRFAEDIAARLAVSEVLVVIIGARWLDILREREVAADEEDFVRLEITTALERGLPIVPVLLEGATLPSASALPPDLAGFIDHNARRVRTLEFETDMGPVIGDVRAHLAHRSSRRRTAAATGFGLGLIGLTAVGGLLWHVTRPAPEPDFVLQATGADRPEGQDGTTRFVFALRLKTPLREALSFTAAVTGGTADAEDFTGGRLPRLSGELSPGADRMPILIDVAGDRDIEADETFIVTVTFKAPANLPALTAMGTIRNDD